jgi:hypothetical protein
LRIRAHAAGGSQRLGRDRGQHALRVRMGGRGQDLRGGADLADLAVAQDDDAVGHLRHHRQVVGHIHRRGAELLDHLLEGAQHVDLRGHVQGRGRLVHDHQVRIGDQGHGRHQALQLAARHLVRVARADRLRRRQGQRAEQRHRLGLGGLARHHLVDQRALDDLVHQPQRRVERGGGALRDVGDRAAAQIGQLAFAHRQHLVAGHAHRAAGQAAAGAGIAHQRQGDGGLARTGLADQGQHFAFLNRKIGAMNDRHILAHVVAGRDPQAGYFDDVVHLKPRFRGACARSGCRWSC